LDAHAAAVTIRLAALERGEGAAFSEPARRQDVQS